MVFPWCGLIPVTHCHQLALLLGLQRCPHPQAGWLNQLGKWVPFWDSFHTVLFLWELCCLRFSCSILHTLFLRSLGPRLSAMWEVLQSLPVLHCWSCLRLSFPPPNQRGSKKRVTDPACRLCLLQSFKLRCWGMSREDLERVTFSAVLPCWYCQQSGVGGSWRQNL